MRVKVLVVLASSLVFASNAFCDAFLATYLGAGVQTPAGITSNYETFNGITPGTSHSFTTNFNNSAYIGTYTGAVQWTRANVYGGAGGSGTYPETFSSYTLTLSASANYFGLWFSALDAGNQLSFYQGSTLLYTFTPKDFVRLVGSCPGSGFCGNPNPSFSGGDNQEQFAYLNFYDQTGGFNRIVFTELNHLGGFESDNQAVATLSTPPFGRVVTSLPEPPVTGAIALVLIAGGLVYRRRRSFNA